MSLVNIDTGTVENLDGSIHESHTFFQCMISQIQDSFQNTFHLDGCEQILIDLKIVN
jgi:hypothetical protein